MKKIAITQRLIRIEQYEETRECLDINYVKLLRYAGFLPIVLPYEAPFEEYFQTFNIDGVVFSGGNDLFTCNPNELSKKRDKFEKDILKYCIENKIPAIGICRGMQLIADYFGSSFKNISGHTNIRHSLLPNNKSQYFHLLKKIEEVNSYHDFTIDSLSDEFVISALSHDNVIKSIEHKECKIFGQMWHSERESPFIENEINLIRKVFA